jgi:hypothetical protein
LVDLARGIFEDLEWIIGRPLRRSFAQSLGSTDQVEKAVDLYHDGICSALSCLKNDGYRLVRLYGQTLAIRREDHRASF